MATTERKFLPTLVGKTKKSKKLVNEMGVVDKIRLAFSKAHRFATVCGMIAGGFPPIASFCVAHFEAGHRPAMWVLVAGGMAFSTKKVFKFMSVALDDQIEAAGIVVVFECAATFSEIRPLAIGALALLVLINGIAVGCNLVKEKQEKKN